MSESEHTSKTVTIRDQYGAPIRKRDGGGGGKGKGEGWLYYGLACSSL
jgi:hypothetical protein